MDILKAEIARKRKLLEDKKVLDPSTNKKYFKRGELLAKEQEEYMNKYGPKPEESELSDVKDIPEKVNRQDSADAENDHTENAQLPRAEVIKRLRERSHPILLFGENELQSFKRLRRIEIQEPEANRVWYSSFMRPTPGTSSTVFNEISLVANAPGGKIDRQIQKGEQQAAPCTGATVPNARGVSKHSKKTSRSDPEPHAPPARSTSLLAETAGSDGSRGEGTKTKNRKRSNRRKRAALAIARSAQAAALAPDQVSAAVRLPPDETHQENTVPSREEDKKQKLYQPHHTASLTQNTQSNLKIAVVRTSNEEMTEEQGDRLKNYLQNRILEDVHNPDVTFAPRFLGKPIFTDGTLKLWCEDIASLEWLNEAIKQLPTSWPSLAVVKLSDLSKKVRAGIYIPECTCSLNTTSHVLAAQNKWAQVNQWTLYSHQWQGKTSLFVKIGIPKTLIPVIMEKGRRLSFGLGNVYLRFYGADGKLHDEPPSKTQPKPSSSGTISTDCPKKSVLPPTVHSPKPSSSKKMGDIYESVDMELASETDDDEYQYNGDRYDPKPFFM